MRCCGCVERCVERRTDEGETITHCQKTLLLPRSLKYKLDEKNREYVFFYCLINLPPKYY